MRTPLALVTILTLTATMVACGDKDGDTGTDGADTDTDTDTDGTDTDTDGTDTTDTDTDTDTTGEVDADDDGYPEGEDCDDTDPAINPGATEVCDDVDNDCDDLIDDADDSLEGAATWYVDADTDGYGNPDDSTVACAQPTDWVDNGDDCDDGNADVNPGGNEICNDGVDDDCDGLIDDADDSLDGSTAGAFYADLDLDGWGDLDSPIIACGPSEGVVAETDDCDDGDGAVNPAATEICNDGIDDDCDGDIDDLDASLDISTLGEFYRDADGDGYGVDDDTIERCSQPDGFADEAGDCNDEEAAAYPGAEEICDGGIDNDCDGLADAEDDDLSSEDYPTWYRDDDGDGYGIDDDTTVSCDDVPGYATSGGDCDDDDSGIYPDAPELCDGIDNDCDDAIDDDDDDVDESSGRTYYVDADGDAYGADDEGTVFCSFPDEGGYSELDGDCDDDDADINPAATEVCDDIDNDCDGLTDDEDDSLDGESSGWYIDADEDGYGDAEGEPATTCDEPGDGYADNNEDCDDDDADVHPGAEEVCNGQDNDCDDETFASDQAGWVASDGTFTDVTDDLADGAESSPVDYAMDEDGSLYLCDGDWYANLTATADVSVQGFGEVTVYGESTASVLAIEGEGLEVTVSDLTLSGGSATGSTADGEDDGGGALACYDSSLSTLLSLNNVKLLNSSAGKGGALYAYGCDLLATNVEAEFNSAEDGGAVYLLDVDAAAENLRLGNNGASADGGGLWIGTDSDSSSIELTTPSISRNGATYGGGILLSGDSELDISSGIVNSNGAELGGGVAIDGDTGTVLTVVDSDFGTFDEDPSLDTDNAPDDVGLLGDESAYTGYESGVSFICDGTECVED